MNQAVKISLISKSYSTNDIGVARVTETKNDVFATVYSVSQAEFYNAGQEGFKPSAVYAVRSIEYGGEDELEVNSERKYIYRTFVRTDGRTELYTRGRKGTNDIIVVTT